MGRDSKMHASMLATLQPRKGSWETRLISVLSMQDLWLQAALRSSRAQKQLGESKKMTNDMHEEKNYIVFFSPATLLYS
jgi:hypothetical protein